MHSGVVGAPGTPTKNTQTALFQLVVGVTKNKNNLFLSLH